VRNVCAFGSAHVKVALIDSHTPRDQSTSMRCATYTAEQNVHVRHACPQAPQPSPAHVALPLQLGVGEGAGAGVGGGGANAHCALVATTIDGSTHDDSEAPRPTTSHCPVLALPCTEHQ